MRRRILLAAFGAVLFFALDSIHVRAGIWSASRSHGVPWWYVFVYFGGIFAAANLLRRFERRYQLSPRDGGFALDLAAFLLLLVLHLLLFRSEVVLALGSLAVLAARLLVHRRPGDLRLALMIAGIDALVEWAMASHGLFAYSHARFALLPLWLLPFWAGLGVSLRGFFLVADRGATATPVWRAARIAS